MNVKVKLFAAARQIAGTDTIEVNVPDAGTVKSLRNAIAESFPKLKGVLSQSMIAINAEYATNETPIPADAEVACIPPVSGG